MGKILFICVGNVRRSPMAEGIFNVMAPHQGLTKYIAVSRGVEVAPDTCVDKVVLEALKECSCKDSAACRYAIQLTQEDIAEAHRVYCMTKEICDQLIAQYPEFGPKIKTMGVSDITDPYDGSIEAYRKSRSELVDSVYDIVQTLK